jgi:hypothetical protein
MCCYETKVSETSVINGTNVETVPMEQFKTVYRVNLLIHVKNDTVSFLVLLGSLEMFYSKYEYI